MNWITKIGYTVVCAAAFCLCACENDMNKIVLSDTANTAEKAWSDELAYDSFLAKIYAGFSASGNQGPNGYDDLTASDQGEATWVRSYFTLQEFCTDECRVAWNSDELNDLQFGTWSSDNHFFSLNFNRMYLNIAYCNEYLRETTPEKLTERNMSDVVKSRVEVYRQEVRVLRAMNYYFLMDLYGNIPIIVEEDGVGSYLPEQSTRAEVFAWIEDELTSIGTLPDRGQYGRVNANVVAMVLAKMYLNAEVYIGQNRYADCAAQLQTILSAGYELEENYKYNFNADNHISREIIYGIVYDSKKASSWGGTTFLMGFQTTSDMGNLETMVGCTQNWSGGHVDENFIDLFLPNDKRGPADGIFYMQNSKGEKRSKSINDLYNAMQGYNILKYTNLTREGRPGQDTYFPDTDFPLYRLADVYLMYAECAIQGAVGADMATALVYVNDLRERAGLGRDIESYQLTLDFIRDERARELYWEGHRRTDLIRLNSFIDSDYNWNWKGGAKMGVKVADPKLKLYPIPATERSVNPNLKQNDGY